MSTIATDELFRIFDARRVKAPELRNLDQFLNGAVGWYKNHRPVVPRLRATADRVEALEPEIKNLGSSQFRAAVEDCAALGRLGQLTGPNLDRAVAVAREAAVRALGLRPFPCQIMGALAMSEGFIAEMATGEGKTLTAALAAGIWAWSGKPVHIIT
ncbi:MAG TPA: hypothetical protein VL992_01320, partial [Tepidisphaeraceae bacterium]|nr:hypothetical protein [Tepidisphaeraceae bacterium]